MIDSPKIILFVKFFIPQVIQFPFSHFFHSGFSDFVFSLEIAFHVTSEKNIENKGKANQ
jgi:hypothetical protein